MNSSGRYSRQFCWIVVLLGLSVASCTSSPEREQASEIPDASDGDRSGSLLEGTAISLEYPGAEARATEIDSEPLGVLELRGCRWRAPGLYSLDVEFEPRSELGYPIEIPIQHGVFDLGAGGLGPPFEVSTATLGLSGPGDFSFLYDVYFHGRERSIELQQSSSCLVDAGDGSSFAAVSIDEIVSYE